MAKSPSIQDSNFGYTAFPAKTGRPLHSEFRLKLEPIVNLSSAQPFGFEVLTQLHPSGNAEHFFGKLHLNVCWHIFSSNLPPLRIIPVTVGIS